MISTIDALIIGIYIIGMMLIGWKLGKNNESSEDYFLAGRNMPWVPIAFSVAATTISANGFIGGPGWAYTSGISPYMVQVAIPLAIFIIMVTTIPVLYNLKLTSIYEYVEMRLGVRTRILAVIGFLANSIIQISSMVFIPSLILKTFTGWDLKIVVPIIVVSAIVYTLLGGIKAVIWTDFIQMIVMWCGLIISIVLILKSLNMGFFDTLAVAKGAGKLNAINFTFDISQTNGFWVTLIGGTVLWVRYFGFDQAQVQRILTAKSMKDVKKSFAISAFVTNIIYFAFMILGVFLFIFYKGREFDNANSIMIDFISNNLPVGVVGIILAGVFAAAMSSVDSLLNSMSTVFVKDIYERFFTKKRNKQTSLKESMIISLIWGIIIIIVTVLGFSGTTKSVLDVVGSYISYISGPMCAVFILGLFTEKANDKGTTLGTILGFIITILVGKKVIMSWILRPAVGFIITFILGYLFSLILKSDRKRKDIRKFTVLGQRKRLMEKCSSEENDLSVLPFKIDKYAWIVLGFFIFQYIFFIIIAL